MNPLAVCARRRAPNNPFRCAHRSFSSPSYVRRVPNSRAAPADNGDNRPPRERRERTESDVVSRSSLYQRTVGESGGNLMKQLLIPGGKKRKNPFGRLSKEEKSAASKKYLEQLTIADYNYYKDSPLPDQEELDYANSFFAASSHSPVHIWAGDLFRDIPRSDIPEVVFVGRSNVGKSSIINALTGKPICHISRNPGRTKEFHAYGVGGKKDGDSRLTLVDIPGYGKGSRPEWGEEIVKYLQERKQLRRVFVLINAAHGMKRHDVTILEMLRESGISHQVVFPRVDEILVKGDMKVSRGFHPLRLLELERLRNHIRMRLDRELPPGPGMLQDFLSCSTRVEIGDTHKNIGIDTLRWAILRATGLDRAMAPQLDLHNIPSTT